MSMRVEVVDGSTLIGTAILDRLDPPMGVAWGVFTPSAEYRRDRHAKLVEGTYAEGFEKQLEIRSEFCGRIERVRIVVEDWTELAGEKHVWAYFESALDYAPLFSKYEDYKLYYGTGE